MATESTATLGRAWALVAYFFGEGDTAPAGVAPELVDKICALHRLDVALAEPRLAVRSPATFLTPEIWGQWKQRHRGALAQSVGRAEPLRRVFEALSPLEAIVFKGAALAELFYPTPGARPMTDVDLLVRPEEAPEAARRLQALGYHCCFELPGIGWLRHSRSTRLQDLGYRRRLWGQPFFHRPYYSAWTFAGPELEIDLHRGLTQEALMSADYSALFERSLPWTALASNARLLCPEDAVVAQAIQPARYELSPSGCPAIGLLDLKLMLERTGPFWGRARGPALRLEKVALRAAEWQAEAFVYAGLSYAARLFPSLEGRATAARPVPSRWRRREIDRRIIDRVFPPPLEDPTRQEIWIRRLLLTPPVALLHFSAQRASGWTSKLLVAATGGLSEPRR